MERCMNPELTRFKALQMYLDLVREIPEVVEVRLAEHDELHTIISAPPDDDAPCYSVIDAQVKVMRGVKDQPFLFLLLNYEELTLENPANHISSLGELVWKR